MPRRPRSASPSQLTLDHARRPTGHGGWRPGAGRPRGRTKRAHTTREAFAARYPQHVTLRVVEGLGSLRRGGTMRVIRDAIEAGSRGDRFRVVHFNVLANHIHLLI